MANSKPKDSAPEYSRRILRLENPVMEYSWGSKTFIPDLLGKTSPAEKPAAELWMGAHPRAPSRVPLPGGPVPLDRLIGDDQAGTLGPRTAERFRGKLPFLLKILAVELPLSIQAHPDREQARAGYLREDAAGIPPDAPGRNYRDPEPKPELICALTRFDALCGFREIPGIASAVAGLGLDSLLPEAARFLAEPGEENLRPLFRALLGLPAPEKERLLARLTGGGEGDLHLPAGAPELIARLARLYPGDIGAVVPLFLNLVRLEPEDSLFLLPGVLHAYLEGAGVEIMAASDNVLRGGLTPKHVDGEELGRILSCRCGRIPAGRADSGDGVEFVYPSPAEEFRLSRILPGPGRPFRAGRREGPEIVFCWRGRARAAGGAGPAEKLERGAAVFIPFGAGDYTLDGEAVLYRASLPSG